ncbi:MAG: hypothetical protein ACTSYS_12920 [Promethearchaeota archaeon]
MNLIKELPGGRPSPSGRYWCLTCKKMFVLDEPRCPYMTKMCVNTPIAIEEIAPETTLSIERFGLFYPKIPQKLMNGVLEGKLYSGELNREGLLSIGEGFARAYLGFLKEWKVVVENQPLQSLKSFILFLSGCETAQRNVSGKIIFLVMDVRKVWSKEVLLSLLEGALSVFKMELDLAVYTGKDIEIESIDLFMHLEVGKYFCSMCSMLFEFGAKKEKVSCPLMPQKCIFMPLELSKVIGHYSLDMLIKMHEITPDIYKRLIREIPDSFLLDSSAVINKLKILLRDEWHFKEEEMTDDRLKMLAGLLGFLRS